MPTFTPIASSSFTGSDEDPMTEGGVWTVPGAAEAAFKRASNTAQPHGLGTDDWLIYTGAAFNDAQYSRANLTVTGTAGSSAGIGLMLRKANSNARTYYRFVIDHAASNNADLSRHVAGVATTLVRWTQAFTDGDQFTLAIVNQVLYVYDKTLVQVQSYDDTGGGGPTTGIPGLSYSSTETSASLDDWEGGNFSPDTLVLVSGRRLVTVMQVPG